MYTILLIDDEQAVLNALITGISWPQLGVDKILTATDGISALQVLKESPVDLLITDIRMPRMDGLELLTEVRSLYPEIHCILLTAYGEFEYARSAMQLGVENYLLKPFQQDELERTIEKALDNIYSSRKNTEQLFRYNILSRWIADSISSEELGERASLLNINIYLNAYCVVCIHKRNKSCSATAYSNSCLEKIGSDYEVYPLWDDKGRYVLIVGCNHLTVSLLTDLFCNTALEEQYQNSFLLSIGPVVKRSEEVGQSYQIASMLLENADSTDLTSHILTQETIHAHANDMLIKRLITLFHQEDEKLRENDYRLLAEDFVKRGGDMNTTLSYLAHSLFQLFAQEFPNKPGIQREVYSRIHLYSAAPGHEEVSKAVFDLLEYSYLMFRYYFEQLSPVIQNAIDCIHKNYSGSISIKEFCAKSRMNTAYLGCLFKKETGMFFNNYLMQYRICCALQLLQETDMQINDIARNVGFSSTSYFISCFKQQVGLSPIKYRTLKMNL